MPNGLRYLRWGGERRSRPTGEMLRLENCLRFSPESPASGGRFVSRLDYLLDELDEEPVPNRKRVSRHNPNDCQNVIAGRSNKPGKRPFHNHMVGSASNSATNEPRTMKNKPANITFILFSFSPTCASWRLTASVSGLRPLHSSHFAPLLAQVCCTQC